MKLGFTLLIACVAFVTSNVFGMLQYNFRLNKQPQAKEVLGLVPYVQTKEGEIYLYLGEYEINGEKIYGSFLEVAGDNKQDLLNLTKSYGTTLEGIFRNSLSEVTVQASSQAAGKQTDITVIFQKVPTAQKASLNFFSRGNVPDNFPHKIREFSFNDLAQSQHIPRWGFESVRKINGEEVIFETTFYDALEKFKPASEPMPQPTPQPTPEPSKVPSTNSIISALEDFTSQLMELEGMIKVNKGQKI